MRDGVCSLMVRAARFDQYDRNLCSAPPEQGLSYLVVGDSFANDARLVLQAAYPEIYFGQLAVPGCLLRLPKQFESGEQEVCRQLYELALFELITNQNYDGIILSSNWQDRHYYRINDLINVLYEHPIDIIVIGQRIRFRNSLPSIVGATDSREAAEERARALIRTEEFAINAVIQERFSDRVKFLDFIALACPGSCDVFDDDGALVYMEDSHLSLAGVCLIADRLRRGHPTL